MGLKQNQKYSFGQIVFDNTAWLGLFYFVCIQALAKSILFRSFQAQTLQYAY